MIAEFEIAFAGDGHRFTCRPDESVLSAMERDLSRVFAGIDAPIPVGCRRGGCGICRVQVVSGRYRTGPMSLTHITADDIAVGQVLACRIFPLTDLELRATPAPASQVAIARGRPRGTRRAVPE